MSSNGMPEFATCVTRGATLLFVWLLVVLGGCADSPAEDRPDVDTTDVRTRTMMDLIDELPRLDRFHHALRATGIDKQLEGPGPYTVFAPLNRGFMAAAGVDSVFAPDQRDTLALLVGLHLVRGDIRGVRGDSLVVSTFSEEPITLKPGPGDAFRVNGHEVLQSFVGRDGTLHVIPYAISVPPPDTAETVMDFEATAGET